MRNVVRSQPPPQSLQDNAKTWTRELLQSIDDGDEIVQKRISENYRQSDVRDALEKMYNGLCCYCEGSVGTVEYGSIEHRKPKGKGRYPAHTFDWDNLNLACTRCNIRKGTKYDETNPILDPTRPNEIMPYDMRFDLGFGKLCMEAVTENGKTTIDHTGLNRKKLARGRYKVLQDAFALRQELDSCKNSPKAQIVKKQIASLLDKGFTSTIKFALPEASYAI